MTEELERLLKKKKVNLFMLNLSFSVVQYNVMVEKENKLEEKEYKEIKKWLNN